MSYTSIQIQPSTRKKLERFKQYRRETYDDVINNFMELVPSGDEEGAYTPEFKSHIMSGLLGIRRGRTVSHEEVKKRLGLK